MILRFVLYFVALVLVTSILINAFQVPFGKVDFFEVHGFLFLVCITFFPRLTLLFSSVASGGILWWLSFIFVPRILVAVLATFAYAQTNPILVTISWLVAIGGESFEKQKITRVHVVRGGRGRRGGGGAGSGSGEAPRSKKEDAIEAEFKRL